MNTEPTPKPSTGGSASPRAGGKASPRKAAVAWVDAVHAYVHSCLDDA